MADILEKIYAAKAVESAQREAEEPYPVLRERALARRGERRGFLEAIRSANGPAIIGEVKRASPSAGLIAHNFDPAAIGRRYDEAGVDCISVITESDHFLGELSYLDTVRANSGKPILRKDFLSRPYEVAQSAAYGADAILLIAAGLSDEQLRENIAEARIYDLDVLLEVHDEPELERASALDVELIGINNRNLRTFETDLAVSEYLLPKAPAGATVISESGMKEAEDIARLYAAGARGFLIGETLMRSDDALATIAALKTALRTPAGA
jgi:indole-3-glycerol phosphate synthase